ncbi:conidial pigment biosynthesis oxidase Abr1/brown 1 [Penicillium canariense]|uniref:Conidial pigment biosynthesis oxidase Abr1/brown 1 n=1 Tax=Penicillium canariense TaxID=189055 RepID=A0A9W9IIT9_9EURO|nr:conidial pigment biosynthesis oxidase Abr1/brown 1 [Penicillium canariense]KAJ5175046.1 conidial pigment biosynthesis oxidase Abr1/brown 1 [Penicillium canariense]
MLLQLILWTTLLLESISAKDVYYDWHVTWVTAAPDGYERSVIGINNQWPCPQIDVDVGDRLIIDVHNDLGNQDTGIHWHGLHQYMTGYMDGAPGVTQCPIPPGRSMRYVVDVNQTGTYWYHSHRMGQYPDGLRGALIVHDPDAPFEYDDEFTLLLSDWYHEEMTPLIQSYLSENDPATGGLEPLPDSALVNDATNTTFPVEPGKTYLIHLIVVGNWPGFAFLFDDHEMTVVEVDGVYIDPFPVGSRNLRLATGQRASILLRTKDDTSKNYAFWTIMDINMMFIYENRTIPEGYNPNATAWLVYDETKPLPPAPPQYEFDFVDDLEFVPFDHEPLLEPVDHQIIMDFNSAAVEGGLTRFVINNHTYYEQQTPTLYSALMMDSHHTENNVSAYGAVNPYVVNYGDVVEIVLNDYHSNLHPWHLHGHQFQCLQRTIPNGGYFDGYFANISATPVKRDTLMVQGHGHFFGLIGFVRVWLFHCHIEWHVVKGMITTIIEAPDRLKDMEVPEDQLRLCGNYPFASELSKKPGKSRSKTGQMEPKH